MDSIHADFISAALADGWTATDGGIWPQSDGTRRDGDRSAKLTRDDVVIWLVDRDTRRHDGTIWRETWTSGWFDNGHTAFTGGLPGTYDADAIEAMRGVCSDCGEPGEAARLRPFRFAERLCPTCDTPERRAAGEPSGWAE